MTTIEDIIRVTDAQALVNHAHVRQAIKPRRAQPQTVELTDNMAIPTPDLITELTARSRLDNSLDLVDTEAIKALYLNLGTELAIRAAMHSFPDLAGADDFIDSQLPKD